MAVVSWVTGIGLCFGYAGFRETNEQTTFKYYFFIESPLC